MPTRVPFSELPGAHERHYRRKLANPLFGDVPVEVDPDELLEAQRLDHEALVAFLEELRRLVAEAAALPPNVASDVVLSLKERLDKAYEVACSLPDRQEANKDAIRRLIAVIMRVVRKGAAGDPKAEDELDQEVQARTIHFELLAHALVADLLSQGSPVGSDELVPTLLSADHAQLEAALEIFDAEQLQQLVSEGRGLLCSVDPGAATLPGAWARLAQMEARLDVSGRRGLDG
jgi:hypothetical protein